MSVPQFVKSKAQGSRLVRPKFDKETRTQIAKELSGIGSNLNQISRVLNIKAQKNEDIPNEDLIRNFNILREEVDKLWRSRSEEHTSELQSRFELVCRLLLEKKNNAYA